MNQILYVEDDPIIAELAVMAMVDIGGLSVRHCESGYEALETVGRLKPDLVLLDMMMPGMDGLETLRHLRELPEGASLPVVFMSARVQAHEQQAYREAGASDVIPKPFDPMTLSSRLRDIWDSLQQRV
ncbi:response regulator [Novosphingobium beihaiensis]|uniref:Response regulator n=1 Tax=Novosphingobium beihaiensis TaxID=2930389 RepID=A0ABT0BUV8_9SPHN|nr:response regulator [Novosphingobium beihaiensis]MCJ2188860.1 response regulator [Novosphingobium beihaiensis]